MKFWGVTMTTRHSLILTLKLLSSVLMPEMTTHIPSGSVARDRRENNTKQTGKFVITNVLIITKAWQHSSTVHIANKMSDLVQNRAILTVSNGRFRGNLRHFGLVVSRHHGSMLKSINDIKQSEKWPQFLEITYSDCSKTTSHFRVFHVDQGPERRPKGKLI